MSRFADPGSFRDPSNRVYICGGGENKRVLRGLNETAAANFNLLRAVKFFNEAAAAGKIIATKPAPENDADVAAVKADGWHAALEHSPLPFVSYPYEWTFSMLRDAALLQLELQENAMREGWTSRDATPYNIQWRGAMPVFIDAPSFAPNPQGEPWHAYRQFCEMFLYPLMLKSHLGIDFNPLLRAELDGIAPQQAKKYFRGLDILKRGVLQHIVFPVNAARASAKRASQKPQPQSETLRAGLLHNLRATVSGLRAPRPQSAWANYRPSYDEKDFNAKLNFVKRAAESRKPEMVWDLGANTGAFARICAPHAKTIIAADSDSDAVEQMYLQERKSPSNILPLILNIANPSPDHGWHGKERAAFASRGKPDLVLCLAVLHHLRFNANIPAREVLDWLRELNADIIIEFVDRKDEMAAKLISQRKEQFDDYTRRNFEAAIKPRFQLRETLPLKNGNRQMYWLSP